MKKVIILLICLWVISANAQVIMDESTLKKRDYTPLKAIVYTVGVGAPFINNDLMNADMWNKKLGFGLQFSIDFRNQFTKEKVIADKVVDYPTIFAVGAGLGFSYYNKSAYFDNFSEIVNGLTDVDGDIYNAHLRYYNINEKVSMFYLGIPLYLEIGKASRTKLRAYGKIELRPSFLLNGDFKGEGTYTSMGFYPEWDITIFNVPHLGFYTQKTAYENPEYKYKPFVLWANLSAGISIPLSNIDKDILRKTMLKIGLKYDFTLTKISDGTSNSLYPGSTYWLNQSNMLGGDGSKIQYFGLDVSLIYSL